MSLLLQGPQMRQHEMEELQHVYEERGLPTELAKEVALHLTKNDAVLAHARDELNIDPEELANPGQVRRATSSAVQRATPLLLGIAALAHANSASARKSPVLLVATADESLHSSRGEVTSALHRLAGHSCTRVAQQHGAYMFRAYSAPIHVDDQALLIRSSSRC